MMAVDGVFKPIGYPYETVPRLLLTWLSTEALRTKSPNSCSVHWWLRDVPRVGDADFTIDRLITRTDDELANGLGNLVHRVVAMIHRYRDGHAPHRRAANEEHLEQARRQAPRRRCWR